MVDIFVISEIFPTVNSSKLLSTAISDLIAIDFFHTILLQEARLDRQISWKSFLSLKFDVHWCQIQSTYHSVRLALTPNFLELYFHAFIG